MHTDAKQVLFSEIVCDVVHTLFFGGARFTFDRSKCDSVICQETSTVLEIVSEIQHRLGYMPDVAKTESTQRVITSFLAWCVSLKMSIATTMRRCVELLHHNIIHTNTL